MSILRQESGIAIVFWVLLSLLVDVGNRSQSKSRFLFVWSCPPPTPAPIPTPPTPPTPLPASESCVACEKLYCPGLAGKGQSCEACAEKNSAAFAKAGCWKKTDPKPRHSFLVEWCG